MITYLLAATLLATSTSAAEQPKTAVVELFTSEGCSSCPRADVLLGELTSKSWSGQVIGLAFHVDYWDRLGWKDRFSDNRFTKRQYRYAEKLPDSRVYTPQMVVDGTIGFVGSYRSQAVDAIESTLGEVDDVRVSIQVEEINGRTAKLAYRFDPSTEGLLLNAALAERKTSTDVKRGENGGRVLEHSHVVRAFKQFPAGTKGIGTTKLAIPNDVTPGDLDGVIYIQDRESLAVFGAAKVALKGE